VVIVVVLRAGRRVASAVVSTSVALRGTAGIRARPERVAENYGPGAPGPITAGRRLVA
jgi:hypothetical protein